MLCGVGADAEVSKASEPEGMVGVLNKSELLGLCMTRCQLHVCVQSGDGISGDETSPRLRMLSSELKVKASSELKVNACSHTLWTLMRAYSVSVCACAKPFSSTT